MISQVTFLNVAKLHSGLNTALTNRRAGVGTILSTWWKQQKECTQQYGKYNKLPFYTW